MARKRIDYGIDLGTTNSALARMESGEPTIKKTDTLKDTMPSCVGFNKKRSVIVGDPAANAFRSDVLRALKASREEEDFRHNFFIEFKRTMGTDKLYESTNAENEYSSEALSSEILKQFRSFITDEDVRSVIIMVPAKFTANQKDATMRAAKLAGFEYCELLHEPTAAAMAYGLGTGAKNGRWLVFDLGGGTFDAALMRAEEGIIKVEDTEGDNYLGGKNIDFSIVDNILVGHLEENYSISSFLDDPDVNEYFRNALKVFAEPSKIQLSFNESVDILSDPNDFPDDDEAEEIELDLKLTRDMLYPVERPVFQKAIDICQDLLHRNGLSGKDLDSLILVGGPTYSPNLRQMLREQITEKVDTSIDPMTAVARGAALYASTIDLPESIVVTNADPTKVQLEIRHEATTVELSELVTIKVAASSANIPLALLGEFERGDKGWSSGRKTIGDLGEVIDVLLKPGCANFFKVNLYDQSGNRVACEPDEFTILQGTKPGKATLPYDFGIAVMNQDSGKLAFLPLRGLERNQPYPATGVANGLKTQKPAGPGAGDILIPLYEGGDDARGTRPEYNEHVYDVRIRGDELKSFLPVDSPLELTVHAAKDADITMKVYFPTLDDTVSVKVPTEFTQTATSAEQLYREIVAANRSVAALSAFGSHVDSTKLEKLVQTLEGIQTLLDQAPDDYDRRMQVRNNLREVLRKVDKLEDSAEWPATQHKLNDTFKHLEEYFESICDDLAPAGAERAKAAIDQYREQIPAIIKTSDKQTAKQLIEEMERTGFALSDALLGVQMYIGILHNYDEDFEIHDWSDRNRARLLINQGLGMAASNPTRDGMRGLLRELISLLPTTDQPTEHVKASLR